ncbi:alpha/beta fold hydrolase [Subtercola boreus]|uniref:Alpha/beta hydrolase n=1 Tax=Subtercola boreus TaxID=120213 RepID=A0A3E0WD51_9MICO|nr:alpha/beta hydrolase [Subtercola boreus]RFA22742.1 alpha/beta hydrolase [Subtercola boreus]RFA23097.1 alpha/beta hydrolase [Subtercola boreus]RFA28850.1 alpha/beta hydrolase [Subtercola boreus]
MSTPFTHTTQDARTFTGRTNGVKPAAGVPLVVALHGGTYSSMYFDIPGYSLLERGAGAGVPIIALDRPNYEGSSPLESDDSIILANAEVLDAAIGEIWAQYGGEASGVVLVGHSIGGAIATAIAANRPVWPLQGLATSGCLVRVPAESAGAWAALPPIPMIDLPVPLKDQLMFGPVGTYADDMPAASHPSNTLVPKAELLDITGGWIDRRGETCGRITVPVFHRQGEFDNLWVTNQNEIDEYRAGFTSAASLDIELVPGSGHCIDFHTPSKGFEDAELAFAKSVAAPVSDRQSGS